MYLRVYRPPFHFAGSRRPGAVIPLPRLICYRGLGRGLGANVTPTPGLQTIASAIQTQEGYYPGSLAYTNNNPGNLMYAGQPGATGTPGSLAVFDSYDDGLQALYNQISSYAARGMSISDMTAVYAPASVPGNNPTLYATNISNALGVSPDASLSSAIASAGPLPASTYTLPTLDQLDSSSTDFLSQLGNIDPVTAAALVAVGGLVIYAFAG